jgi:hypothetical protein
MDSNGSDRQPSLAGSTTQVETGPVTEQEGRQRRSHGFQRYVGGVFLTPIFTRPARKTGDALPDKREMGELRLEELQDT